jgi:hypothetical protein
MYQEDEPSLCAWSKRSDEAHIDRYHLRGSLLAMNTVDSPRGKKTVSEVSIGGTKTYDGSSTVIISGI